MFRLHSAGLVFISSWGRLVTRHLFNKDAPLWLVGFQQLWLVFAVSVVVPSEVRYSTVLLLLCFLIVGIHASGISIPLSLLMLLGWNLLWVASLTLRVYLVRAKTPRTLSVAQQRSDRLSDLTAYPSLKRAGYLSEAVYNNIRNKQPPGVYGLPKLRKVDVPLRPIVPSFDTFAYDHDLSAYLANILSPLTGNSDFTVTNSAALQKIGEITHNQ